MHREFCTLFDSNYLFKALALYDSLDRHCESFHLTAFCFDEEARRLVDELRLPSLSTVSLPELEAFDPELLSVKEDRTREEYCWTATPALPLYMFGMRPDLAEVTYMDADLMFFADPEPLFEEMGDASVLITPHRFSPEHRQHIHNGIYNVQFLPFRRDRRGLECLQWWHDRCIEWCYHRLEDGKQGDQKYLDDWPERFEGIHVLRHKGGGVAPWNVTQYRVRKRRGGITVDGDPLIFFHYYQVKLRENGPDDLQSPWFPIPRRLVRIIYRPYLKQIAAAIEQVREIEPGFSAGFAEPQPPATTPA